MAKVRGGDKLNEKAASILKVGFIYSITITRPNKEPTIYIGQASNFYERKAQHLRALKARRHDNVRMQRSFVKYGLSAFTFAKILLCKLDMLTFYEQLILDFYRETFGEHRILNVMRDCVTSHIGVKRRPETIERMSNSQKGRPKPQDQIDRMAASLRGRPLSLERRRHLSEVNKGLIPHPNSLAALRVTSKEKCARISAGKLASGYSHPEKTRKKISLSLTGRVQSETSNLKRSMALSGRKKAPETIAKRTASRKANARLKQNREFRLHASTYGI